MADLADALDLALEVGELVQESGGQTTRTVDHMVRLASALGATECHPAISSVNVAMTVADDQQRLSGGRHAGHLGINFSRLTALKHLVADAETLGLTPSQVRSRLLLIRNSAPVYPPWLLTVALGASTSAFAALFGAGTVAVFLAFLGGWAGAWVRLALTTRGQMPFVSVTTAAFVSGWIVATGCRLAGLGIMATHPALAACALFLVPGVPMLNGTADLLTAHYLNGVVKLAMSAVILTAAAIGLSLAVAISGVVL